MLNNLGIRIRDQYHHPETMDAIIGLFSKAKTTPEDIFSFQIVQNAIFVKILPKHHRWWSPELTITLESNDTGSIVKEVTGPNPSTFTLSMFVLIGAVVILFFALIFAASQISLDTSPTTSFLITGGCILIVFMVLAILGWGRKKAQPQMDAMKLFVKETLSRK